MSGKTYKIALGGIVSALAVAMMFFGSIIPFATFVAPAAASLAVLYFCLEFTGKTAFAVYAVIAALAVLVSPDKEQALLFACFFGYYPVVKLALERSLPKAAAWICKLLVCDTSLFALYYIITQIFVIDAVREEFAQYTSILFIVLAVLGDITFVIFDLALTRLSMIYLARVRPKITKHR
ncbi:MAG: hypothetical protein RR998_04075 [Oscillospiraceae bacterium]